MIELTKEEKKLITDIFNNFPIQGNKTAVQALVKQMDIILIKVNQEDKKEEK